MTRALVCVLGYELTVLTVCLAVGTASGCVTTLRSAIHVITLYALFCTWPLLGSLIPPDGGPIFPEWSARRLLICGAASGAVAGISLIIIDHFGVYLLRYWMISGPALLLINNLFHLTLFILGTTSVNPTTGSSNPTSADS